MNKMARPENMPERFTLAMTSRTSFTPLWTAESSWNGRFDWDAMIFAKVVFPTPGGPHKIMEGTLPPSTDRRSTWSSPTK
jgi:hypothetical protein